MSHFLVTPWCTEKYCCRLGQWGQGPLPVLKVTAPVGWSSPGLSGDPSLLSLLRPAGPWFSAQDCALVSLVSPASIHALCSSQITELEDVCFLPGPWLVQGCMILVVRWFLITLGLVWNPHFKFWSFDPSF